MRVLITGGAGYIGSHTCIELLNAGYELVVVDNLYNSSIESLKRVQALTGQAITFYQINLVDREALNQVFDEASIDAVVHFAGLKAVGESVALPLRYYQNNIVGTLNLCDAMMAHHVKNLIFSSSATVYGNPTAVPITEDMPLAPTNPYGRSKLMIEEILRDLYASDTSWNIALLRYFNPIGAHPSGLIGEDPHGIPNNLVPNIAKVAIGLFKELKIFGNDYPTPDGTAVRDYIHVVDLALGHLKSLQKLQLNPGLITCNLGTGRGYSVMQLVTAFEKASGKTIACRTVGRRPGDAAICYAATSQAQLILGWTAKRDILEMCEDVWRWQTLYPNGYNQA